MIPDLPPWSDGDNVPLPTWVRSVEPKRAEIPIYEFPGVMDKRRGTPLEAARLPYFADKRAPGCTGRWLSIGPLAWVCSDAVNFSPDPPSFPEMHVEADGLPFRYFFVGREGAHGFLNLARAEDDPPDQELEPGWALGTTDERAAHGERWVLTNHGQWIPMRELGAAHPIAFQGVHIEDGKLDVAWVNEARANVYGASKMGAALGTRVFREVVHVHESKGTSAGTANNANTMVRISDDGAPKEEWMRARDLISPQISEVPEESGGALSKEKWIDVDTQTQTLVAYEGARPVFATLVSTGKGTQGSPTATRLGAHRIWVKLVSTNMGNLENEEADEHYSIEDVPWVQFFDKGIALHGAFWHHDFGHVHSHGCVNLAPLDARFLFFFTGPHMPRGWNAVLPDELERGTVVRVR